MPFFVHFSYCSFEDKKALNPLILQGFLGFYCIFILRYAGLEPDSKIAISSDFTTFFSVMGQIQGQF